MKNFYKNKYSCLVVLLALMFLDYSGYGYYIFYLPFFYLLFHKGYKLIDKTFCVLFMWGILYVLSVLAYSNGFGYVTTFIFFVNFPFIYLIGKYLARRNDEVSMVSYLFFISLALAAIAIISVIKDVLENGFLVIGMGRNIPLIGINNEEGFISATVISTKLLFLLAFLGFIFIPLKKSKKLLFLVGSFLSIYCAVRVQSRTCIVAIFVLLLISFILNLKSMSAKKFRLLLISLIILIGAALYIYTTYSDLLIVFDRFETDEAESGGGRFERLMIVGSKLWDYPLGGMNMNNNIGHAHNLWLDCGRVAGVVPLLLLLYITFLYIFAFVDFYKLKSVDPVFRLTFTFLSFVMLVGFVSEPILEGIPMFFAFFCLLLGVLKEYSSDVFLKP